MFLMMALAAAHCAVPADEAKRLVALTYDKFDVAEGPFGWRQLNGSGCTDAAVALLDRYRAERSADLTADQRSELACHAGQALAFAGRGSAAIPFLEAARAIGGTDEWLTYIAGNLAFLRKDRAALRWARDHYAQISPASDRLGFLDGFLACPDKDYMAAAFCKP